MWIRAAALALGAVITLTSCGGDPTSSYCREVSARQKHLSEIVDSGDKDALVRALPDFRALERKAPGDIRDEWATVIQALDALREAVRGGDEDAIAAAATALTSSAVETALTDVQQQVRDVCHTPLTL